MKRSFIAIPIGDPAGVGPEIVAKSIASEEILNAAKCVVIGNRQVMENAIKITRTNLKIKLISEPEQGDYKDGILNLIHVFFSPYPHLWTHILIMW